MQGHEFQIIVSGAQLLVPPICAGVLFYGFILYAYLSYRYSNVLYRAIALLSLVALLFVANEAFLVVNGAVFLNRKLAVNFHRLEQISGAYFLFALPFALTYMLKMNNTFHRVNRIVTWIGLAVALVITVVAFVLPDLYISVDHFKKTAMTVQSDYSRGAEGPLYMARDILLGIVIIYSTVVLIIDMVKNDRFKELHFPVIGILIAMYSGINDMQYIYTRVSLDIFSDVMFSRFSLGLTIMVLFFMAELTRRYLDSTLELEQTHRDLEVSEKRYRFIIEETSDAIFTMTSSLKILNGNKAAYARLPLDKNRPGEIDFFDLVHVPQNEEAFLYEVLLMKIEELQKTEKPMTMKLELKSRKTGEPEDYTLMFEYIHHDQTDEILVKASSEGEDGLKKYVDYEKGRFVLENYLLAAEEISKRLVQNIPSAVPGTTINQLRLGLREILINAIEHGNLGITFEEKAQAMVGSNYLAFLISRQQEEDYRHKKITVEFKITSTQAIYKIADEGNGFDHRKIMERKKEADERMLSHGRGVSMALEIFDDVTYNNKGNQVLLVKNLLHKQV